jgi:predicted RNase H-like HicB family nuclease
MSASKSEKRSLRIEVDREEDGRWIAEVAELPGVLAYGGSETEAVNAAKALALRVLADRIEAEHSAPALIEFAVA